MNTQLKFAAIALIACTLPMLSASAGDQPFPKRVPVLGSGVGEILVPPEPGFDVINDCYTLGMRVDPRSNYLFVAGCFWGNAHVFDADTGEEIMNYQLAPEFSTVINDLAITRDAVYFTDFGQPFLYRLPLSRNGRLPAMQTESSWICRSKDSWTAS